MAIIGIDLGTTNSACSIWKDGKSVLIPNALGQHLTPSVISVDEQGNVLVGQAAKERLITHVTLTASKFKRAMGTQQTFTLGQRTFTPIELSALVLTSLKADAEAFLGESIHEAVISVPAYFNDHQRKATKLAGELAGLNVERLINEPTAAALSYGLADKPDDARYMILDLGGGTFDVTILEYFDGVMEVHASAGDNHLGGEDFVELLVNDFLSTHQLTDSDLNNEHKSILYRHLESIKRQLTTETQVTSSVMLEQTYEYTVTQSHFETLAASLLSKIQFPIERAVMDANIKLSDIDEIVLVGGATKMPLISRLVARLLRRFPAFHLDPDEVIALGAGVQAGLKADDEALKEIVLTDVCPYSLGIAIHNEAQPNNHFFSPLIERNCILPASIEKPFCNAADDQSELLLDIYQGERPYAKDNVNLGSIPVKIPKSKAGDTEVLIRFSYDMNGLLEVEAKVEATGETFRQLFERQSGTLTDEQKQAILEKLSSLKIHPREDMKNRALLARLERIFEQSRGDLREHIHHLIGKFELCLEKQDPQLIARMHKDIASQLQELENGGWLE